MLERSHIIQIPSHNSLQQAGCSVAEIESLESLVVSDVDRPDDVLLAGFFKNACTKGYAHDVVGYKTLPFVPYDIKFQKGKILESVKERSELKLLESKAISDVLAKCVNLNDTSEAGAPRYPILIVLAVSVFKRDALFDPMSLSLFLASEFTEKETNDIGFALGHTGYPYLRKIYSLPEVNELVLTPESLRTLHKALIMCAEENLQMVVPKNVSDKEAVHIEMSWLSQALDVDQIRTIKQLPNYVFSTVLELIRLGFRGEELLDVLRTMNSSFLEDLIS